MNRRTFPKLILTALASAPLSAYADVLDPQALTTPNERSATQNTPVPKIKILPNAAATAPPNSPTSPADSAPPPVEYSTTRWAQTPFALGLYSFSGMNPTPKDYQTLAQPIGEQLFFAGEHTQKLNTLSD